MKSDNKEAKISFWAAHATTVVSVTLVLIIVGIISMISVSAEKETRRLREQIELSAIMSDSISNGQAADVMQRIGKIPGVRSCTLVSKEQALAEWRAETNEDIEALFGVNIFSPEVTFTLYSEYTEPSKMASVEKQVAALPGVEEVSAPDSDMVQSMNKNITSLSLILAGIGIVLLLISFVLINNTVHLSIHSRRFTIHTMRLVGATGGFIRRPFMLHNMLAGVLAGVLADGVLAAVLTLLPANTGIDLSGLISWQDYSIIAAGLILTGAIICTLSSWIATARYLHKDYDDLFK